MCIWKESVQKKLVRSKPLKNIIHMVSVRKRYEKASEKLTPRGPLSPFYYSRLLWCCRKKEIRVRGWGVNLVTQRFQLFFLNQIFFLLKRTKFMEIFHQSKTAFLRHYALWQYFVMTTFGDGLLKTPRDRENGLKITVAALLFAFSFRRSWRWHFKFTDEVILQSN